MRKAIAIFAGIVALGAAVAGAAAQEPQGRSLFREGECSGVLCSSIGGSQAPQNQPRKSLFPEGQCGGVLCSAIGGSQAPQHAEAPPACGGGILCDMAPYAMGQPFVRPAEVPRAQPVAAPVPEAAPEPKAARRTKGAKTRKRTAAAR